MNEGISFINMQAVASICPSVGALCKVDPESTEVKALPKRKLKRLESVQQNIHLHLSNDSPQELARTSYTKRLRMSASPQFSMTTRSKSQTVKISKESKSKAHKKVTNGQAICAYPENVTPDKPVKAQSKKAGKKYESKRLNFSSPVKIKAAPEIKVTVIKSAGKSVRARANRKGSKDESKHYLRLPSPAKKKSSSAPKGEKKGKRKHDHTVKETQTSESDTNTIKAPIAVIVDDNSVEILEEKGLAHAFPDPKQVAQREDMPSTSKETVLNNDFQQDVESTTNYQNLLALTDVDLVRNTERFECPVCFVHVDIGEGVTLQECIHSICRRCLVNAVQVSESALVRCPFRNDEYSCESHLQDREIKSLLTSEAYEHHLQRSVAFAESQAPNSFHCKTPDCPGWYLLEGDWINFVCPVCLRTNCLICGAIHEGKDCLQHQDDMLKDRENYYTAYQDNLVNGLNVVEAGTITDNVQSGSVPRVPETKVQWIEPESKVEKRDYENLLALGDVNLVTNVESFECPICFSDVEFGEGAVLQECLHSFCRECLAGAVQFSETAVVHCPFRNDEYSCDSHLQEREIKSLVTPEVYEKHLQRSVALAESQAQNSFHCKTPDCSGWCLFEDAVNVFPCPVCYRTNCLMCAAIHEGKNCKQYQDDLVFLCDSDEEAKRTKNYLESILQKGQGMRCPQCQIIIVKKEGCDWFMCSMCKTEICWRTKGPRWGPGGHGDTSGGCKCMLNGVRCHSGCRNCH